ncbi:MAG: carbonic anhydrase [Balneolaceae bacterium]|nr:carbonic anhydrase [Balneolaceae bacterium]
MFTKKTINFLSVIAISLFTFACTNAQNGSYATDPVKEVLTKEKQDALTPQEVLEGLKAGNERYVNNDLTSRDWQAQVAATAAGQFPEAVIISCLDSRVPVEQVFDKGVGDVFVGRIAGNNVNTDMLGSIEFGTAVAGSKVVIIMGHESCGAVKSAIDDVQVGNITALLSNIKPAIAMTDDYNGEQTVANGDYVTEVVNNNVRHTIEEMRKNSPIIAELERNGDILIAGAFYDLDTGKVTFID